MRALGIVLPLCVLGLARASGQGPGKDSAAPLVEKLGSSDFRQREAAAKALRQRPDAEAALEEATQRPDLEMARRAGEILRFLRLGKLQSAAREGRADRLAALLGRWPAGDREEEVWDELRRFAGTAIGLHRKRGGKIDQEMLWKERPKFLICAEKIQSGSRGQIAGFSFLRSECVDLASDAGAVIVSTGAVRFGHTFGRYSIFAGGDVEVRGDSANVLIIACGDVKLNGRFHDSLFISKGNVTCLEHVVNTGIISGGTVAFSEKREAVSSIVVENDSNPLGFIRWADTPKDKDGGKTPAKGGEKKQ